MPKNPKPVVIATEEPKALEVTLYDRTLLFYEPTTASMLDLTDLTDLGEMEQIKAMFQFLLDLLDEDDREWLDERFHDHKQRVTMTMLNQIVEAIVEAFVERPTMPPSASSPPRKRTGRASTGPVRSAG